MRMLVLGLVTGMLGAGAAAEVPPVRQAPGWAQVLPDGTVPPVDKDGDFVLGPTHGVMAAMEVQAGVPRGRVVRFTMRSGDAAAGAGSMYPGIARDAGTFGVPEAGHPERLVVTTSHPAAWERVVTVYVPAGYMAGTEAPLLVGQDGPDGMLFGALDNLIAEKKVPAMVAVSIGNGGGDAQGSERGLEYDTVSGRYAEWVQHEVLPRVEREAGVRLTNDPEGRATMGGSSGGVAALMMAWFHPEWYRRVLMYSGTMINQQWPWNAATPHGAYGFAEGWIAEGPVRPIRIWMEVGDRDLYNPNAMRDGMHDWVEANDRVAQALKAKGYHYQFVFAENAGHVDGAVKRQTLPEALEYVWRGYATKR